MMFVAKIYTILILYCFFECHAKEIDWDISNLKSFTGFLYKNSDFIQIHPQIKVKTDKDIRVCNFILRRNDGGDLPFLVNLKSSTSGTGEMVVIGPINQQKYVFYIQGKMCDNNVFSKEIKVVIKIIAEEVPRWEKSIYNAAVFDDVKLGSEVARVRAYELGRTSGNSICDYKITAPIDAPFDIDGHGVIRTTNRLDARKHRNFVLRVTAIDCWMPIARNSSISVNIEVKRVCKFGWNGLYEQINYQSGSGIKRLGSSIKFSQCFNNLDLCFNQGVTAHLKLNNQNTKMCDRDLLSLRHQWKTCGVHEKTIELLPSADQFVREDHGSADPETGIYTFDGIKSRWEIPTNIIPSDHFFGNNFTFSFWMSHNKLEDIDEHKKEQVLCNSDGDGKNRHHYSLFLHNCKLIFLYRTEPYPDNSPSSLSPAEWRFQSPEMCDNHWHHYSLVVETVLPNSANRFKTSSSEPSSLHRVKLYIDGAIFLDDLRNPEIIDDMPMHALPEVHFTKLAIGACWHTQSSSYIQHFKGQLAGVTLLRGSSEPVSVIECINQCHERLVFTGINKMVPGTSISINSLMSTMTITASNVDDVGKIIDQMGYTNSRLNPLPGRRTIGLYTDIKCSNSLKFKVPYKEIQVVVLSKEDTFKPTVHIEELQEKEYGLRIRGDETIELESHHFNGKSIWEPILPNVMITYSQPERESSFEYSTKRDILNDGDVIESCLLHVQPPLNKPQEYLAFANRIIEDLADKGTYMNVTNSSSGLIIEGRQRVFTYQFVLQRINYFNSQPDQFQDKNFKLVCSKNSIHMVSNELEIKLRLSETLKHDFLAMQSSQSQPEQIIHKDSLFEEVAHKGQSEMAGLQMKSVSETTLSSRYSNVTIIMSVSGLVVLIAVLLGLLRMAINRNRMHMNPFSRSTGGPWVRLKPNVLQMPFSKKSSLRASNCKHIPPAMTPNGELEWDNSEIYTNSLMDDSLKITVNPLLEHEKSVQLSVHSNSLSAYVPTCEHDDRSLDGLPDEYDGRSEDFRDLDDEEGGFDEEGGSLGDDLDTVPFWEGGRSASQGAIWGEARGWLGPINIHQNPRYCVRKSYSQ